MSFVVIALGKKNELLHLVVPCALSAASHRYCQFCLRVPSGLGFRVQAKYKKECFIQPATVSIRNRTSTDSRLRLISARCYLTS